MATINKFKNAWVSTDTGLSGPNQACSLLNEGKSEFKSDVVVDTKLAVSKAIDTAHNYKLDVGGDVNFTGNLYKNGSIYSSGASLSDNNTWTGTNTFSSLNTSNLTFTNVASNISITNYNFYYATPNNNTPLFNNVSGTNSISGWTFTGNNYSIYMCSGPSFSPDNRFVPNNPSPSANYLILEIYSGGTFLMTSSNLTLQKGEYTIFWSSYFGWINTAAVITVTIGGVSFSYNDSQTRNTGLWTSHTFEFAIGTAGTYNITVQYTDTSASGTVLTDACFSNFIITYYNSIQITDGTNTSYISPTLSNLKNPYLVGNTNIVGNGIVKGSLVLSSAYGSNNIPINNSFGYSSSSNNINCVAIGANIGLTATACANIVFMGNNVGYGITSSSNTVSIGNNISGANINDVYIGSTINSVGSSNNCIIGYNHGFRQGGIGSYNVCVGTSNFGGYNGFGTYTTPSYNIAVGSNLFTDGDYYDLYNIAIGFNNFLTLRGNTTTTISQDNIAIGRNCATTPTNLNNCIFLGSNTNVSVDGLNNVVCIGYGTVCGTSSTIQLGSNSETVAISGNLKSGTSTITPTQLSLLTSVNASAKLPTTSINGITNYLLTTTAASTYQPISGMSSYLLSTTAASTYQTITGMSSYLTSSSPTVTNTSQISFDGSATTSIANNLSVSSINSPISTITINPELRLQSINSTLASTDTLTIGSSTTTTKLNGSNIRNNVQKINGYSILSGSPNNLTLPLSEYYTLSTSSAGAVTLPVITSDMYGTEVTFNKLNATNTYTINAGSGNFFRLIGSSSSATQTSISMSGNFTILRIVATQSTIWDVLVAQNFQRASTSLISASTSISFPFFQTYSLSATVASVITLPTPTIDLVGTSIVFRRVSGTVAYTTAGGTLYPINSLTATTSLLTATQYVCEIQCLVLSATRTYAWFVIRLT